MSVKQWFLRNLRRAVGTQAIIETLAARNGNGHVAAAGEAAPGGGNAALESAAAAEMEQLYHRILDPEADPTALGFRPDQVPCLIDINGDLLWIPADCLSYLWHTRATARPRLLLHFLAETPHYRWIRQRLRPGETAVDCGANLGLFSTMMARCVAPAGCVHAFEPSPSCLSDLRRVLALNRLAHLVVINACAVAERCGEAAFCDVTEHNVYREASHLEALGRIGFLGQVGHQQLRVPTIPLDDYVAQQNIRPRLVKIDVEGAEFLVLEGARSCVRDHRPLLVVEIHPDDHGAFDHPRLRNYLDEYGYRYTNEDKIYYAEPK